MWRGVEVVYEDAQDYYSNCSWLVAAIYLLSPLVTEIHKYDRDTAVVSSLRTIHNAQAQFKAIKGQFGTLKELADMGLIGQDFAAGKPISQFIYTDVSVSSAAYCVCANRARDKAGRRDYNIIEDGEIRYHESETPGSAVCGKGIRLSEWPDSKR